MRSILCEKCDDGASAKDFDTCGDFQDCNGTVSMFQQKFRWKIKKASSSTFASVSSSVDGYLRKDNASRGRLLVENSQCLEPEKPQKIYEAPFS